MWLLHYFLPYVRTIFYTKMLTLPARIAVVMYACRYQTYIHMCTRHSYYRGHQAYYLLQSEIVFWTLSLVVYITYTSSVCPQWNCLSLVFVHLTFYFSFYFVRLWANGFPMASRDGSCSDLLQAWLGFHCGIYPTWLLWWRHFDSDCYRVKQTSTLQV